MPEIPQVPSKEGKSKGCMFITQTYKVQTGVNNGPRTKISIILPIHPHPLPQM